MISFRQLKSQSYRHKNISLKLVMAWGQYFDIWMRCVHLLWETHSSKLPNTAPKPEEVKQTFSVVPQVTNELIVT
jgi:hypothetical protein